MILSQHNIFAIHHFQFFILSILISSFGLGQLLGAPILGSLSDRYGRKTLLTSALIMSSIGYLVIFTGVYKTSLLLVILGRLLSGVSSGNSAILFAIVGDESHQDECGKNMGYLTIGLALGGIVGPLFGSYFTTIGKLLISEHGLPFLAMFFIYLALIPLSLFINIKNESHAESKQTKFFQGIVNLKYAFTNGDKNRKLFWGFFAFAMSTESLLVALPMFATTIFHTNAVKLGWLFAAGGVASLISGFVINTVLSKRFKSPQLVKILLVILNIAYILFLIKVSYIYLFLPWILMTATCLLIWSHANTIIVSNYANSEHGYIMGVTQSLVSTATLIGPILVGAIAHFSASSMFFISIFFGLISLLIFSKQAVIYHEKMPGQ
jgi:DHA1 family tetracycline resistance protein-like MFS transporter